MKIKLLFFSLVFLAMGGSLSAQSWSGQSSGTSRVVPPYLFCVGEDNGKDVCLSQTQANVMKVTNGSLDFVLTSRTVATLPPASLNAGRVYRVIDGTSTADCTAGGGLFNSICTSDGTIWTPLGGGGGGGGGSGTVLAVGATAPLVGGPITVSGTLSCPTCVISPIALPSGRLLIGGGLQAISPGNLTGDCTTAGNAITNCTKTNGVPFATSATTDTTNASNISSGTLNHARLPALVSGDIPNNAANTSGSAGTAAALTSLPTNCGVNVAATGILANGNATGCFVPGLNPAVGPVGTVQTSDGAGNLSASGVKDDGASLTVDRDATFLGPNPTIDLTRWHVRAISATIATTGSINSGTNALTVANGGQLINGDGIVVRGAGANCTVATPDPPTVTASNASNMLNTGLTVANPGATTYQYQVVAVSVNGCYTPASTVTVITNGQATLGTQTVNISSWTRANNVVTVTTSSAHTLVTGSMVWITAGFIDGFYQVTGSADNTHFTVNEGQDTRNGAAASGGAGGTVSYWVGNHISWVSKAGTMKYLIYGRTSGSMALIGVSLPDSNNFGAPIITVDPLYNTFDDWGSTITKTPTVPDYYPTTPPGSGKNNDLITTIASGGGTNNIVTTDAATNTVAGVVVKFDNTAPLLAAITATYGGATQGGVLRFPTTAAFYVFNSMFVLGAFPSTIAVQQDGPIALGDTIIMQAVEWNGGNPISLGTQFGFSKHASITSGTAHPMLYTANQNVHFSNISIAGSSNSQNLWVLDAGAIPASSWYDVNFGNAVTDWAGQGLIIRNNINGASDFDFKNVSFGAGPAITDKDPTPLFQVTQGLPPFNFDRVFLNRRGMYLGSNTNGTQGNINNIYCQGCIMPKITLNNTTAGVTVVGLTVNNSIDDTVPTAVPILAYFGNQLGTINFSNANGLGTGSQMFNGNGSVALNLRGVGQASQSIGQSVFVNNIPSAATAVSGTYSSARTAYPLMQSDMAVAVGAPFSIYVNSLKQPAPTCSNTGAGTVPAASYTFKVAPVFASGGEGPISDPSSACSSNGSQQITINWTLATGAIGYDLYANGFSFQCAAPWVSGGSTLSYIWTGAVTCGQSNATNPGAGPSGISSGSIFSPQFTVPAIDGGGFGAMTAPHLSSNPAWSMPDNGGVGIFATNPTTPTGVAFVPVFIPGTTPANSSAAYAMQGIVPNAQSGATYTILATDRSKIVTFSNAAETYVTIPQSGTAGFTSNIVYRLFNRGTGLVVLTPTTSTINGLPKITMQTNMFCTILSDNTNYLANCETYTPFNIDNYGAVGDLTAMTGVSLTAAGTTLTCTSCAFTSNDIGKTVLVQGGGASALLAYTDTVATITDGTHVTLTTHTSGTTVSGGTGTYGTDNGTAIAATLTAAGNATAPGSSLVVIPSSGEYLTRTALTIPGNVSIQLDGYLQGANGVAAVLQTTTNTSAPFWEHQRIFGGGVLDLGSSAFRGIWMHQGRHNDISGINVRGMGQTNSVGIQVGDPTAGQVGGYETIIFHVSFGTHNVSGGSNSRCVSFDNTTNGKFTDSQTDALVGNGCALGIFDGQGGDRNSNGHFWGPSLATAFSGAGDFWVDMEADTPSSVGFEVSANEQISNARCFFSTTGTDNTATCIHSATTEPSVVITGLRVQGVDGSHRWASDSNLLRTNLSTSSILGVQSTNVVTQNISGNPFLPGVPIRIASGTSALNTGAITSGTCDTAVTTAATGTATTDTITYGFNGDPTGVTGYTPVTTGRLDIMAYPTANNVNFKVCNRTSSSITPGAITLNWQVIR